MIIQGFVYYFLWGVLFIFSVLLTLIIKISEFNFKSDRVEDRYDYIIVGGGSAGSIIAARLSENSNVSILLIEAGGIGCEMLNVPALGPLKQLSGLDWQYSTIPQKNSCLGLTGNVSKWPSGKILGGSTHLNYMIYNEGHKRDFFTWKDPISHHWSFEDISYYFNKAKKCHTKTGYCFKKDKCSTYVRKPMYTTDVSDAFLRAAKELGYASNDFFLNENTGFSQPQLNLNEYGRRWTSDQFLRSIKSNRKNLKIITNSLVEQIIMLNGFEALAVKYENHGIKYIVHANMEIVLCAGAIASPKLLMLSGIGPKNVLDEANILMKNDLPVGKNLQDHITTGLDLVFLKTSHLSLKDFTTPWAFFEYFFSGSGPLTSGLVDAIGIIHSSLVHPTRDSPDLEFMVMMAGVTFDKGIFFKNSLGISQKTWEDYFKLFTNETSISILPVLLHPKSIGEITLDPFNPNGNPKIDPKYLSQEDDLNTLVEGIRIVQRLLNTKAMKNLGAKFNRKKFPKCEIWKFDSDDYWRCYIKHLTLTVYHPVGTCKMGKLNDGGVVDHKLRVYRTNKLRVIDASIMPTLPSANINAAVIMIAEKGADLIKEDAHSRFSILKSMVKVGEKKWIFVSSYEWTVSKSVLNNDLISVYVMMEENWTWKNSNGSLQTCSCSETKFCNSIDNTKYIFLDSPLEFRHKSSEIIVENFAANFISKLFYEAFKMTCKITWSVPCSLDCHSYNLPFWNDSIHDLRLYLTPELLRDKKLCVLSPFFSASKSPLTKLNNSKIKNSEYTKTVIPHLFFTNKTISDMYNVPFDSDIYAIPLDVIKDVSHSQNQTKFLNSHTRYYNSSSSFFGQCIFSGTTSTNTNSNCRMKLYGSENIRCDIVQSRYSATTCTAPEAVHITMEEVREYLKTLYSTSYHPIEGRNFISTVKLLRNPLKSVYNNLPHVSKPKTLNNRKTYIFAEREKKKNNICNFTTDPQKLNSNDKLKNRSTYRRNFPVNFKQILCSIFRIKKLPFSHHNFCRGGNNICSDKIGGRLSNGKGQNHVNPKVKPPFSKRALPPLPRLQDGHKNTFHKECGSVQGFKENCLSPLPPPRPPPPPAPLTFKSRLPTNSVDFAASIEKVKNYGWYWGPISGEAAEKILTNEPDGSFIVRDSSDDYYIFSLTFKLNSIIRHVRIEHDQGNFSFGNSTRFKSHTIVDFIESAVEHSRSGRYLFFLHRRPVLGPMRVQLLHPVSRFKQVQSLQHLSRFVILKIVRKDLISSLPLPKRLLNYLSTQHYYSENLTDEDRIELPGKDNVDQFIQLEGFS